MLDKTSFKGGLNINFLDSSELESIEDLTSSKQSPVIARNVLRLLMMGWPSNWHSFLTWKNFRAVFIERDHDLLKALRLAFQQGFLNVFEQLKGKKFNLEECEQVQIFLSNCLTLLPYSDLTPYESIKIPQLIESQWSLVEYKITPIELTHQTGFRSLLLQDHDRVFAYGLEPILNIKAQPHLIFMGTTYPAGQGFIPQVSNDLKGMETVGQSLYESGRDRIIKWLSKQNGKIHVCGVSLGGSLGALFTLDQGEFVTRADLFNPAGLHDSKSKSHFDNWDSLKVKPQVVVQQQGDDPVSAFGEWKEDWEIVKVIPPVDKKGPNAFFDHFLNYAGFAETEFTYIDPIKVNEAHATRNLLFYTIGRTLVYYPFILPFNYVLRPTWNLIWNNKFSLALGLMSLLGGAGVLALVGLGSMPAPVTIVSCILLIAAFSSFSRPILFSDSKSENSTLEFHGEINGVKHAKLHDPKLPRNVAMDLYHVDNTLELKLPLKDLHMYHKIMRCIKNKELIPKESKSFKDIEDLTKKELLAADPDSDELKKTVVIKPVKAKALHITHTLTLVNKLGIENKELEEAVDHLYKQYAMGKTS